MPVQNKDWKSALGNLLPEDYVPEPSPEPEAEHPNSTEPSKQMLFVSTDSKQRKGKTVTIVRGFEGSVEALEKLGKSLKTKCGSGGSVKDGEIILQGDFKQKVSQLLTDDGYKVRQK